MLPQSRFSSVSIWIIIALLFLGGGCGKKDESQGRTVVNVWPGWAGFERSALDSIVDDFNQSQDRILVKTLTMSEIEKKLLLAVAGGHPPDLVRLPTFYLPPYAQNNALLPLDKLIERYGIQRSDYIPVFYDACIYEGQTWALPITASMTALHYNKKMFRDAGLDPEKPPTSIAELEKMNEQILRYRKDGSIELMGHLPVEPDWWVTSWPDWFGKGVWDKDRVMTLDTADSMRAFEWIESYPKRFGADKLLTFKSGFGTFASPQNAFMQGKVAMVMQGIWMDNFINNYASDDFEYGVAFFPSEDGKRQVTIAEPDSFSIPAGAKHPQEAFEFLMYLQRPEVVEKLALNHRKMTSLVKVSDSFFETHPHPYIESFYKFAQSPDAVIRPQIKQFTEFRDDFRVVANSLFSGTATAAVLIPEFQTKQQALMDKNLIRWNRVKEKRLKEWASANPLEGESDE